MTCRILRVMDNYLFYEPLHRLKAAAQSGEIGEVAGYHMKMTGSGLGGWDVPWSSFEWQLEQMRRGRGILVFDDGWHKLSTALWLFGPVRGSPRVDREYRGGAPAWTSTRRPRSCGSTTTASAACGTSPWRPHDIGRERHLKIGHIGQIFVLSRPMWPGVPALG